MCALRTQNELKFTNRLGGEPSSAFLLGSGSRGVADIMFAFFKGFGSAFAHLSVSVDRISSGLRADRGEDIRPHCVPDPCLLTSHPHARSDIAFIV